LRLIITLFLAIISAHTFSFYNLEGILRFKVPQNIDMPDRIVGPLTMAQFIYAVIGGGIAYAIYSKVPAPFGTVLALPIALFTAACTFVKIQEQPFLKFLMHFLAFASTPQRRVWKQASDASVKVEIIHKVKETNPLLQNQPSKSDISDLAGKIDSFGKGDFLGRT